ncbi:uncharacterized protein EV422DRAFT_106036 [Fimicolochytrium jonesii]|uniref:uncharacterized protein n=1 Tax=Fimicolochytrium jonesii TaxID=1396493 RepID=UPI0022FF22B0|nr:uncharacterized protein EV422DRAFT_106036 [Fimicolochytrium jonesii]KAI8819751.1 hypothetical protein EV422DRAFT_106036 [Fimicolochytrium jonesii]
MDRKRELDRSLCSMCMAFGRAQASSEKRTLDVAGLEPACTDSMCKQPSVTCASVPIPSLASPDRLFVWCSLTSIVSHSSYTFLFPPLMSVFYSSDENAPPAAVSPWRRRWWTCQNMVISHRYASIERESLFGHEKKPPGPMPPRVWNPQVFVLTRDWALGLDYYLEKISDKMGQLRR